MNYKNLFRTYKQMDQVYRKVGRQGSSPYFYKIQRENQHLFFVGSKHSFDKFDSQFEKIKTHWNEFLSVTDSKNKIVFVEGGLRPVAKNLGEAIKKDGEMGYITYLAAQQNVPTYSPEPGPELEANTLLKKFSKDEIMYMYFARNVAQWNRLSVKPDFDEYMNKYFAFYKKIPVWKHYDMSLTHFIQMHNDKHDHPFDKENYDCFHAGSSPSQDKMSAEISTLRDEYHLSEILGYWEKGFSIFIVYGSGHAITMEPALKKLLV